MNYSKVNQIAKGWSSYIWIVKDETGKEFVLKEVREKSPRKDLAEREGKMLQLANSVGVGPKVIEVNFEKNFVVMEYIRGVKLFDWIMNEGPCKEKSFEKEVSAEELYFFIKELYRQLFALEKVSLSHNQLQVGKNIVVEKRFDSKTKKEQYFPVIIDFEKATIKMENHTKNIGQIDAMLFYNPNGAIAKKVREKLNLE
ncbi:MAG: hypothetical protein WCW44_01415 [archaeon]|jgi:predicted Ser/Thr protein kinase